VNACPSARRERLQPRPASKPFFWIMISEPPARKGGWNHACNVRWQNYHAVARRYDPTPHQQSCCHVTGRTPSWFIAAANLRRGW
jgi:hypothetical protein